MIIAVDGRVMNYSLSFIFRPDMVSVFLDRNREREREKKRENIERETTD